MVSLVAQPFDIEESISTFPLYSLCFNPVSDGIYTTPFSESPCQRHSGHVHCSAVVQGNLRCFRAPPQRLTLETRCGSVGEEVPARWPALSRRNESARPRSPVEFWFGEAIRRPHRRGSHVVGHASRPLGVSAFMGARKIGSCIQDSIWPGGRFWPIGMFEAITDYDVLNSFRFTCQRCLERGRSCVGGVSLSQVSNF